MKYSDYLKTTWWSELRGRLIRRHKKCEHCFSTKVLQVHHLTYRGRFNEKDNELMVLCSRCHLLIEAHIQTGNHERKGSLKGLKNFTHNVLMKMGVPIAFKRKKGSSNKKTTIDASAKVREFRELRRR